ncbi:hypothetical protein BDN72DRAFT_865095, partial [Pluteus cervinus]
MSSTWAVNHTTPGEVESDSESGGGIREGEREQERENEQESKGEGDTSKREEEDLKPQVVPDSLLVITRTMNLPRPADLHRDPKLLLHTKPSGPLSIYHGRVGAVIREGESFITSPNSSFIPQPPLGGDRSVFLREDFRYGDDDPLQWPQPFIRSLLFLSAIPLISDHNHPLAVMSDDLSWSDFTEDDNDLLSGIGKITNIKYTQLSVLSTHILDRAEKFSRSKPAASVANLLGEYTHLLRLYLHRLEHVTTNFSNTRFTFRGLQRIYLYLLSAVGRGYARQVR